MLRCILQLPTALRNSGLVGLPDSNHLINYLTGSAFSGGNFSVVGNSVRGGVLGSVSPSWSADIPNKKRKTNVARFGIDVGNGNVTALSLSSMFELKLPATGIFSGQPYEDVLIGVGDGNTKTFKIPSANVKAETVSIKINGVSDSTFTMESLQQLACKIKNPALLPLSIGNGVSLTADGKVMAVAHESSPFISTYDWVEDAWIKRDDPTSPAQQVLDMEYPLTPDGKVMAVAHESSPFISTYDWVEDAWIKRDDPTSPAQQVLERGYP